jgi:hypothetical protein
MAVRRVFERVSRVRTADLSESPNRGVAQAWLSPGQRLRESRDDVGVAKGAECDRRFRGDFGRGIGIAEQAEQSALHGLAGMRAHRADRGRELRG